jgi:choline-sulfatase
VPLIVSNPVLFPEARETDALASLADVTPTMLDLAGVPEPALQGRELTPILARHCTPAGEAAQRSDVDLGALTAHPAPADSVQDAVHFTYDDHQAATATTNGPGQPNRLRAVRVADSKYVAYLDPAGRAAAEYELYDLGRDPNEAENLVDFRTGEVRRQADEPLLRDLQERLRALSDELGTGLPLAPLPPR